MKQVAPLVLHSPKPIRALPRPVGYSTMQPLATPFLRRASPSDSPFSPSVSTINSDRQLESLVGLQHDTEDSKLCEVAEVEREMRRLSFPRVQSETGKRFDGLATRRSCPALFVPERPTNPMSRDGLFNDDQGHGMLEGEVSGQF
jgi:hypothetical protein